MIDGFEWQYLVVAGQRRFDFLQRRARAGAYYHLSRFVNQNPGKAGRRQYIVCLHRATETGARSTTGNLQGANVRTGSPDDIAGLFNTGGNEPVHVWPRLSRGNTLAGLSSHCGSNTERTCICCCNSASLN